LHDYLVRRARIGLLPRPQAIGLVTRREVCTGDTDEPVVGVKDQGAAGIGRRVAAAIVGKAAVADLVVDVEAIGPVRAALEGGRVACRVVGKAVADRPAPVGLLGKKLILIVVSVAGRAGVAGNQRHGGRDGTQVARPVVAQGVVLGEGRAAAGLVVIVVGLMAAAVRQDGRAVQGVIGIGNRLRAAGDAQQLAFAAQRVIDRPGGAAARGLYAQERPARVGVGLCSYQGRRIPKNPMVGREKQHNVPIIDEKCLPNRLMEIYYPVSRLFCV